MDILKIIGQQKVAPALENISVFKALIDKDFEQSLSRHRKSDTLWLITSAYLLGYMDGKRAERKRCKKR